jgi:hypothetical protein
LVKYDPISVCGWIVIISSQSEVVYLPVRYTIGIPFWITSIEDSSIVIPGISLR